MAGLTLALVSRMLVLPTEAAIFLDDRSAPPWAVGFLFLHIAGGMVALASAMWNLLCARPDASPTRRHGLVGRMYVAGVVAGATGAAGLIPFVTTQWAGHLGIGMLVPLWVWSAMATIRFARLRDRARHRRWALRSAALTGAAVTLRFQMLALELGGAMLVEQWYGLVMWTSWVPNVLVVEFWLVRQRRTDEAQILQPNLNPCASTPPAGNPTR